MTAPLIPATLALREDGTPYSPAYDDIYHSAAGALAQAEHVFLHGNALPARWQGRRTFTVLETGFGIGGNFLATWAAWRADPARCTRLHFVSVEKHPFVREDLRALHARVMADTTVARLAAELARAWPTLVPGLHRLAFDEGRVVLTLALGDALELLPKLWLRADAFYLDGFSPAKNPDLWSPAVYKSLARLAGTDATLATYSCAGHVRRGLEAAGFVCEKVEGFAGKRTMLAGRFAPRWRVRRHEPPAPLAVADRHVVVVGAGLAGTALLDRLVARGWRVSVVEAHAAPAQEASGNPAGVFHPLLARDDSVGSKITRAGFLLALSRWQALEEAGHRFARSTSGLVHLADDDGEAHALGAAVAARAYPEAFVRSISADEATTLAGTTLARGGWFYPAGGSLDPAALCRALCDEAARTGAVSWHFGRRAERMTRGDGGWHLFDAAGDEIATAPVVVFANAHDAARLAGLRHAPTRVIRGQLTRLPAGFARQVRLPVIGDGYAVPLSDALLTGATYELDDRDTQIRPAGHRENLDRIAHLIPGLEAALADLDIGRLAGRVAFRSVAPDRLPFVGALPDETASACASASLRGAWPLDLPRASGLYGAFAFGSRGLVWATLAAELVASQLEGEPWPIERELAESIDPARYLLRALRTGHAV
jgi:tRNA 5-methylaminomethyl-2-thiouridine biosynthesis bifunctional protein